MLALAGCSGGRVVISKSARPESAGGRTSYIVLASVGAGGEDAQPAVGQTYTRVVAPDDPWVRHCYDQARVGVGLPYYCVSGRTPLEALLIALSLLPVIVITWLAAHRFVARLPEPAPVAETGVGDAAGSGGGGGDWLLSRQARERSAFEAARGPAAQARFATGRYALRSVGLGALYGLAVTAAASAVLGWRTADDWVVLAAAAHIPVVGFTYIWWALHGRVGNRRHLRALFAVGGMIGLATAGVVLLLLEGSHALL